MNKYTGISTLENMSLANFYNKWTFNKFKKYLKGDILEVGCGIGNFTEYLSKYGFVTAIDIDVGPIKKLKEGKDVGIDVGYGDIEKGEYFFKKKIFDTIVCINVLEHIYDDLSALKNIYKLLRSDGYLILLVPIHNFLYGEIDKSIGHFRRYNLKDLIKKLVNINYSIIFYRKLNFFGALGWFVSGRILKNKQITGNKIKLFNFVSPLLYLENLIEPIIGTSVLVIAKKE